MNSDMMECGKLKGFINKKVAQDKSEWRPA